MAVRIGILGFAHGHVDAYINAWRKPKRPSAQVVAGWDHDFQRVAKAKDEYDITMYDTPEDLLSAAKIDAVVIAAETSMHAELVEMSARAGRAIVLQKPMALTI